MKLDEDYEKVMNELQENFGWSNIDILPESYQDLLNDTIMAVKNLNTAETVNSDLGSVIRIPIEPHFAGGYRLEYDGKYITLYGKDNRYKVNAYSQADPPEYEEMVLISAVLEVRNATPTIKEVTDTEIVVDLGCV